MPLVSENFGPTLCIGEILAEFVCLEKGKGFNTQLQFKGPYPSGAPAIFIDQCGRIGASAAMIGMVGNDDFGYLNINRLKKDGVDVSGISIHPKLPTGTAFVRYHNDGRRDFVFNMWTSAAGMLKWSSNVQNSVKKAGHLHIMGTLLSYTKIWKIIQKSAKQIKTRGGTISLDPNIRPELLKDAETKSRFNEILGLTNLLLPSNEELAFVTGITDVEKAINYLFSIGVDEIALKKGANGATVFTPKTIYHEKPLEVVETDPTGAGDCFGGTYVGCRRLGMQIPTSLKYANAAGARNVTIQGPMEGVGTLLDLDTFINKNSRSFNETSA